MSSFIDPASLSLPSPSPSTDSYDHPSPSSSSTSRKRQRSSDSTDEIPASNRRRTDPPATSDDRKEARAHRNRIAAQNSRDRRKAQFSYLEHRVQELEDENRQLRLAISSTHPLPILQPKLDHAREKENEELKERIRTLEKGWDAVVKALATQGLVPAVPPTPALPSPAPPTPASLPSPPASSASPLSAAKPLSSSSTPPPISALPNFLLSTSTSTTTPTFALSTTTGPSAQPAYASTRHSARVATTEQLSPVSLQRVVALGLVNPKDLVKVRNQNRVASKRVQVESQVTTDVLGCDAGQERVIDDATMEDLFRQILAPSPSVSSAALPSAASPEAQVVNPTTTTTTAGALCSVGASVGGDVETSESESGGAGVKQEARLGLELGLGIDLGLGLGLTGIEAENDKDNKNKNDDNKDNKNDDIKDNKNDDAKDSKDDATTTTTNVDWSDEVEMQRILDDMMNSGALIGDAGSPFPVGTGVDAVSVLTGLGSCITDVDVTLTSLGPTLTGLGPTLTGLGPTLTGLGPTLTGLGPTLTGLDATFGTGLDMDVDMDMPLGYDVFGDLDGEMVSWDGVF